MLSQQIFCFSHDGCHIEKRQSSTSLLLAQGKSPPRVRGKGSCGQLTRLLIRITPACAGKRFAFDGNRWMGEDHPRVCGEKVLWLFVIELIKGSPPRVRGKATSSGFPPFTSRITPACAGKRQRRGQGLPQRKDHPRVCGEKSIWRHRCRKKSGSPPRVRGKVPSTALILA